MEIKIDNQDSQKIVTLVGRLDTTTAPDLEAKLPEILDGCKDLTFDFKDLEYLSSAGLRIILNCQKTMSKQGKMVIRHVNETVMDVFDMTGFSSILTIED